MSVLLQGAEYGNKDWFEDVLPFPIKWGANNEGRTKCPFPDHDDQNPSFSVNTAKGVYYCHGCHRQGSLWELTQLLEGDSTQKQPLSLVKKAAKPKTKKMSGYEFEYIYRDCNNEPHLLVAVNGSGTNKTVHQYHYEEGNWFKGGVKQQYPYHLQDLAIAVQKQQTIFIVEGEKDVNTLKGYHLVATTNAGGAGKWPKDDEYNQVFTGANVVILPDNDEVGNKHSKKVAKILKDRVKTLKIVELPELKEKEDVTDWLKTLSIKEFKTLVETVPFYDEMNALANEENDSVVTPNLFFEKRQFQPVWLAKYLLENTSLFFHNGLLYIYENGVYRAKGEQKIKKMIQRLLEDKSRKRYVDEVLNWLKIETSLENENLLNPEDGYINVKNGLLDWKTGELKPHTEERLSTIQIPVEYRQNIPTTSIENFFKDVVPEDTIELMAELFGYCMIPTTKYQTAFMFTGEGANGKSTVIELLTNFVGTDNITNISLQDLDKNRFKAAQLHGKLLNTFADISHRALESSSMFKSIVSGDRISAEFKGKDAFDFRPFARLVFSANELPTSRDVTEGFFRRWKIIPFPYSFDSSNPNAKPRDPNLLSKITTPESLSEVLNFAVNGLRRIEEQKGFTNNESTRKALEQYKKDSDNVALFLEEMCLQAPYAICPTKQLFAEYETWCDESGYKSLGKKRFNLRLNNHIPNLQRKRQTQGGEVWLGVGLLHQH
ncbi:phage/plasmid primase, P4 family [Bacillaceae bacterium S4-13-58]